MNHLDFLDVLNAVLAEDADFLSVTCVDCSTDNTIMFPARTESNRENFVTRFFANESIVQVEKDASKQLAIRIPWKIGYQAIVAYWERGEIIAYQSMLISGKDIAGMNWTDAEVFAKRFLNGKPHLQK